MSLATDPDKGELWVSGIAVYRYHGDPDTDLNEKDKIWYVVANNEVAASGLKFSLFQTPPGFREKVYRPGLMADRLRADSFSYLAVVYFNRTEEPRFWDRYLYVYEVREALERRPK